MFGKMDDMVAPTPEGVDSCEKAGLCSPAEANAMRSCAVLQAKLPDQYRVVGHSDGANHPWVRVAARWDGKAVDGDVSKELGEAVKPLTVSFAGFAGGMFAWMVQAPPPEEFGKEPEPAVEGAPHMQIAPSLLKEPDQKPAPAADDSAAMFAPDKPAPAPSKTK
jgi:hypothetical protein